MMTDDFVNKTLQSLQHVVRGLHTVPSLILHSYIYIYISWPCHFWLKFREADWQVPIKSKSCCVMRIHLQHFMACQHDYNISHFSSQPPSGFPPMTFSNFQVHSSVLCWSCMRWSLECKDSFTSWPSYTRIFLNSYRSVRIPSPVQFKPTNVLSNIWHRTRGKCAAGSAQMSTFCEKRNQQHWRARSLSWSRHEVTHRFTLTFAVVGSSE